MEWDKESSLRLEKIPVFVRRLARSKIEKHASENGRNVVTVEDVESAKASFMGTGSGKSDKGVINADPFSLARFSIFERASLRTNTGIFSSLKLASLSHSIELQLP